MNPITVNFKDLGIRKQVQVRDLWQHKVLGSFDGSFTAQVPRHGAILVKVQ